MEPVIDPVNRIGFGLAVAALLISFVSAGAQAKPGDLLIAHQSGPPYYSSILATTPGSNRMSTVAAFQPTSLRGVMVGPNNTDYYAVAGMQVYEVKPGGVITTIQPQLPVGNFAAWNDLDENGEILVGTGFAGQGALMRLDRTGRVTTILMRNTFPLSFCLDRDSGDVVMGDGGSGNLYRIRRDGTISTLNQLTTFVYSMDYHPPTGTVLIGSTKAIYQLSPWGPLSTFTPVAWSMKALAVFQDGSVAAGGNNVPAILHYDVTGGLLGTIFAGTLCNVCMAVEDEHNLWGLNTAQVGGILNLSIRFAGHANKPYVAAAALSTRPGLRVDLRTIPLTPDHLFVASFRLPHLFRGFAGRLDQRGCAAASVNVPQIGALRGFRLFLAAVVLDRAAPSGIAAISRQYGFTIM